jgi:hypothetical protein
MHVVRVVSFVGISLPLFIRSYGCSCSTVLLGLILLPVLLMFNVMVGMLLGSRDVRGSGGKVVFRNVSLRLVYFITTSNTGLCKFVN